MKEWILKNGQIKIEKYDHIEIMGKLADTDAYTLFSNHCFGCQKHILNT